MKVTKRTNYRVVIELPYLEVRDKDLARREVYDLAKRVRRLLQGAELDFGEVTGQWDTGDFCTLCGLRWELDDDCMPCCCHKAIAEAEAMKETAE